MDEFEADIPANMPVKLDAETLAALDAGIKSELHEKSYSLAESIAFARKCAKEWMNRTIPARA